MIMALTGYRQCNIDMIMALTGYRQCYTDMIMVLTLKDGSVQQVGGAAVALLVWRCLTLAEQGEVGGQALRVLLVVVDQPVQTCTNKYICHHTHTANISHHHHVVLTLFHIVRSTLVFS